MEIRDTNYFSVQAWMVTKLNLRGAERDAYAIIYGYSQDEDSDFHGSLEYLSQLTGYSRNALCTALKGLTDKGLILKTEKVVNNIKQCRYRTSSLDAIQAPWTGIAQNEAEGVQAPLTNNKAISNLKDNKEKDNKNKRQSSSLFPLKTSLKEVESFKDMYNEICNNLPKVKALTDKREKAIRNIIKKYSLEDIKTVLENVQNSDFLTGKNDRGWKANLDFILSEDKFVNILEGKYSGHAGTKPDISKQLCTDSHIREERSVDKDNLRRVIASGKATKF